MQADQRRVAVRLTDQQRHVLVGRVGRAKGDDLRVLRTGDGQAGAGGENKAVRAIVPVDRGGGDARLATCAADEKGREQAGEAGKMNRSAGTRCRNQMARVDTPCTLRAAM